MSLKQRTLKAIFWDLLGSVANKSAGFIISIFLARILTPEEFGLIGMVMVFVTFSVVLMDVGLGSALIQRQEVHNRDYSSVLILNAVMGGILMLGMFFLSDIIGDFYQNHSIPSLCKALSVIFLINSLGIIPKTKLTKELKFKKLAQVSFGASIVSGVVGIIMAFNGFGVWSLVAQIILSSLLNVTFLWVSINWFPGWTFSWSNVKSLWGFGFNIFLSSFLNNVLTKLDILLIGKLFSPAQLGYYTRAQSVTTLMNSLSGKSTMRVFFPAMSEIQHDKKRLNVIYEKGLRIISCLAFSLIGVLFLTADSWFILIFSTKWNASVPFLKIMLLRSFVPPLSSLSVNVLKATGKSRQFLHSELIKKSLYFLAIAIGFNFGIMGLLIALLIQGVVVICINLAYVSHSLKVRLLSHLKIVFGYTIYPALIFFIVHFVANGLQLQIVFELIFKVISYCVLLVVLLKLTNDKVYSLVQKELVPLFSRT